MLHEEILPNVQSKPPLVQPITVFSCPITYHLSKQIDAALAATWGREGSHLIHVYKYLMEGSKEDRVRLFSAVLSERTGDNVW